MEIFNFIQITEEIDYNRELYSYVSIPTPEENYEATMKYYKFPNMKNAEMRINPALNHTCDKVYVYVRDKNHNQYAVFNYNDYVEIRIEEIDNFRFSDVLNIAQITTNLKIEWDEIKSLIP